MTARRDYILRMIEQMGAVLARLRQLVMGGTRVEEQLQAAARQASVNLDMGRALDADSLIALLAPDAQADVTRVWVMAELLFLDGLKARQDGNEAGAREAWEKAARLYASLDPRIVGGLPEAQQRVTELEALLQARH
jgi:hypothetical protein